MHIALCMYQGHCHDSIALLNCWIMLIAHQVWQRDGGRPGSGGGARHGGVRPQQGCPPAQGSSLHLRAAPHQTRGAAVCPQPCHWCASENYSGSVAFHLCHAIKHVFLQNCQYEGHITSLSSCPNQSAARFYSWPPLSAWCRHPGVNPPVLEPVA